MHGELLATASRLLTDAGGSKKTAVCYTHSHTRTRSKVDTRQCACIASLLLTCVLVVVLFAEWGWSTQPTR